MELLFGVYIGIMYAIGIMSYLGYRKHENNIQLDIFDWIFIVSSPISVPLLLISELINPTKND